MKLEINGRQFDSEKGYLTIGDIEQLEEAGIDFKKIAKGEGMGIKALKILAGVCLKKCIADGQPIDDAFVAGIPVNQLGKVSDFVNDFFSRNFPAEDKGS